MPNTTRLDTLASIDASKNLFQVQNGQMSMTDYLSALEKAQGVKVGWDSQKTTYTIDFGKGLKDPSGQMLTIEEVREVVKALMPSPLASAGKRIVLRGPMPGIVSGLVARVCYAADVAVKVITPGSGLETEIKLEKLERDNVKLVNPGQVEREEPLGSRLVQVTTANGLVSYKRRPNGPTFNYGGVLELVFIETGNPKYPNGQAQVYDPSTRYYAWVRDLSELEDVEV